MIQIQATIMKLSNNKKEVWYKNGNVYYIKHKWWDEAVIKRNVMPVAINYTFTAENIVGYVVGMKIDNGDVVATFNMEMDEDLERRMRHTIFLAGLINTRKMEDMLVGTIHSIGMVNRDHYPFKENGMAEWKIVKEIKE